MRSWWGGVRVVHTVTTAEETLKQVWKLLLLFFFSSFSSYDCYFLGKEHGILL